MFHAHSDPDRDEEEWQRLLVHLLSVARLAASFGRHFGLECAAFCAGLFHDLGKYDPAFQAYIRGKGSSIDHSTAGAQVLLQVAEGQDKAMAEIIAYAILGHHAGLPDRLNTSGACFDERMKRPLAIDDIWRQELGPELLERTRGIAQELAWLAKLPMEEKAFAAAFAGRMIFSCLVDADFKNTESFYTSLGRIAPDREWPLLRDLLDGFRDRFDAHMRRFEEWPVASDKQQALNRLRADILSHVRAAAAKKPGFFTLTVPTGGGKTLSSLGFALDHARLHGHRRIIYAIPFTSIIDQTVAIFRDVLGEDHVLEHHSNIDEQKFNERERRDKLKLAMEDWAAPVVVTTNVQLFESLFSARPARSRKLHNIANSVIILDEAQTLPRSLLLPVMRALEELTVRYGCTVVLCTATQPALGKREGFDFGLPLGKDRELAPDPGALAQQLARTRIRHAGAMDNAALIDTMRQRDQILTIVNSRRHALDLYKEAKAADLAGVLHLTTRQYAADRRKILAGVRKRLAEGLPCRLIATSLIEAGVDVDFPAALRAEAGLDQIIQAAGRVNREGRRPLDDSLVTVFSAPDYPPPVEIRGLIGDMKRIIDRHSDLTAPDAIEDYFCEVYWRVGAKYLDSKEILKRFMLTTRGGTNFAYRQVGADFRMIESGLVPVIVAVEEEALEWVEKLSVENVPTGLLARKLQAFAVQVPPKARERLRACGHVAFIAPELRGDQFAVLQKASLYSEEMGLIWEDADYLAAEDMLW